MPVSTHAQRRPKSIRKEVSDKDAKPQPPSDSEPDTDQELIKAYAGIFRDGVTGLQSALNSWLELLPSSSRRPSHRGLIAFTETAARVALERDNLESIIKGALVSYRHVKQICTAIGDHIGSLRDFVEEFMRNAWVKVKDFASDLRDSFWNAFKGIKDGLLKFVSWVLQAVLGAGTGGIGVAPLQAAPLS